MRNPEKQASSQNCRRDRILCGLAWTVAAVWAVLLFLLSSLHGRTAARWMAYATDSVQWLLRMLLGELSPALERVIQQFTPLLVPFCGFMILAFFIWLALRRSGFGPNSSLALSFAATVLCAVLNELHQVFMPGRLPRIADWLVDTAGAFCILAGIALFSWMWNRFPKLVNRETVSYVVFGALTTLINIVFYMVCYNTFGIPNLVSNTIAWVAAVLFAYVVNKLFVFCSHNETFRQALREFALFIGARVLSLGIDLLGMYLLVDILSLSGNWAKIGMNVIVLVLNYIFSKLFIFRKNAVSSPDTE